jgi:signal transduction histidine kinase/DNA-binding NarL/FixJ family response regulator
LSTESYRRHFLGEDAIQGAIAMAIISFAQLLFVWNDHVLFGFDEPFAWLVAVRSITFAAGTTLAVFQLRSTTVRAYDQRLAVWCALLAVDLIYSSSTRPPDFIGHGAPTAALVICLYSIIPGPLAPRAATALAISFFTFVFSMSAVASVVGRNALLVTHVAVHAVGMLVGQRMTALRKSSFATTEALVEKARALAAETVHAQALAHTKAAFLATMSHELRTPMNAVLGLSELLTRSALAPEQRAQAQAIHDSAGGLLVVLNDILDMAKVDAGRITVVRVPFDVRKKVQSVDQLFRSAAAAKGLQLTWRVESDVPAAALGDPPRIRQVLSNLVSNAIKFTAQGSVSIEVSARDRTADGFLLVISVADTGPGIAPELRERLFQPFEQGTDTSTGGTGLGLAISKRLAEAMGGTLRLDAAVGRLEPARATGIGARFELALPTAVAAVEEPIAAAPARAEGVHPLRILVADDNAMNRRVALAMLSHLGYDAATVDDGEAAVAAVERSPYDVVFLDLRMPGMGGLAAAQAIRARHGSRPRLLALTASTFVDDRATCLAAGMEDVLTKPIQLDDLRRALVATRPRDPAIDGASLAKLRQLESATGGAGLVGELCTRFLADAPGHLAAMTASLASADAAALERGAHSLKGSAAFLGAVGFARLCGEIEEVARHGQLEPCARQLADLREELSRVTAALAAEVTR